MNNDFQIFCGECFCRTFGVFLLVVHSSHPNLTLITFWSFDAPQNERQGRINAFKRFKPWLWKFNPHMMCTYLLYIPNSLNVALITWFYLIFGCPPERTPGENENSQKFWNLVVNIIVIHHECLCLVDHPDSHTSRLHVIIAYNIRSKLWTPMEK